MESKRVQHVDFKELSQTNESDEENNKVRWADVQSPAFSVSDLLQKDELKSQEINIDEIPYNSLLHLKKERSAKDKPFEDQASRDSYYMQLTIGRKVMVYDL